ncbi:MAG: GNAT family N-acetyltransferase [Chloroflexota bacterium]
MSKKVTLVSEANADWLMPHFPWKVMAYSSDKMGPLIATIVDDVAVSICYCSRLSVSAAEAGVETAEGFRGRGFAGQAVAYWAESVRRRGLIPLYSTSWENKASQRVAHKLDMVQYGENWHIT